MQKCRFPNLKEATSVFGCSTGASDFIFANYSPNREETPDCYTRPNFVTQIIWQTSAITLSSLVLSGQTC